MILHLLTVFREVERILRRDSRPNVIMDAVLRNVVGEGLLEGKELGRIPKEKSEGRALHSLIHHDPPKPQGLPHVFPHRRYHGFAYGNCYNGEQHDRQCDPSFPARHYSQHCPRHVDWSSYTNLTTIIKSFLIDLDQPIRSMTHKKKMLNQPLEGGTVTSSLQKLQQVAFRCIVSQGKFSACCPTLPTKKTILH